MIDQVLYEHIRDNLTYTGGFEYGSAEDINAPYIVMIKVADPERPEVLCQEQGQSGRAVFQFSGYLGGNNADAATPANIVLYLEAFKDQVNKITGVIGTTTQYRINNNSTEGVRLLSDGASSNLAWGAIFETTIWWEEA